MRKKLEVSLQDLIYCFNQLSGINTTERYIYIIIPKKMSINDTIQKEGLELQQMITFEKVNKEDGRIVYKLVTQVDIVTQY